ncbi:methyltransferase family protein [Chloroflexota bacterium]
MIYITIGIFGFLAAFFFDMVSLRSIPRAKPVIWIIAVALIVFAHLMVCVKSERLEFPIWLSGIGWALLPVFIFLFLYSLFVNLPFRQTYVASGIGNELIRTGTYALVRHPGVLWYAFFLISLILVSESKLLLIASPIWLVMDTLHVIIQDKFLFSKMFEDYDDYRQETPMLIPNMRSMGHCLRTITKSGTRCKVQEGSG